MAIQKKIRYGDTSNNNFSMSAHDSGVIFASIHNVQKTKLTKWKLLQEDSDKIVYTRDLIISSEDGTIVEITMFKEEQK